MSRAASSSPPRPPLPQLPPLTRSIEDRVVAGVAAGIAQRFGLDVVAVRIAFVVLAVASGTGLLLYLLGWLLIPDRADRGSVASRAMRDPADLWHLGALALLVMGGLLLVRELGVPFPDALVWPLVLVSAGLALVWRERGSASPELRDRRGLAALGAVLTARRGVVVRVLFGVVLVFGGIGAFLAANLELRAARDLLLATAVAASGVALIVGPWGWRLARALTEERRERIRSEERAEVAAHVHDSVLQSLALIQKADDPRAMASIARRQERELRTWLYGGGGSGVGSSLRVLLDTVVAEVEDHHDVAVEPVVVGDCPASEPVSALVAAAREAMVNAAKFSGAPVVSLYAEVEDSAVVAYVRDRGAGFDTSQVPADRRGIAESIVGRMTRHGGRAVVRSAPGDGTEVELRVPRSEP